MLPITYTQAKVAWPDLMIDSRRPELVDDINVSLTYPDGGSGGEFTFAFYRFPGYAKPAVRLECFGDGLPCLFDERMQRVIHAWKSCPDPDAITPAQLIAILEICGATPSEYHTRAGK